MASGTPPPHAPLAARLGENRARYGKPAPTNASGLAGHDLSALWDVGEFRQRRHAYCREFMQRMHHPFHEVLACLYLDRAHQAIAYNRYFRGEADSALTHLPTIAFTARQLAARHLLLACNVRPRPDTMLAAMREFHDGLAGHDIEVHDFLLLVPGQAGSLLTGH